VSVGNVHVIWQLGKIDPADAQPFIISQDIALQLMASSLAVHAAPAQSVLPAASISALLQSPGANMLHLTSASQLTTLYTQSSRQHHMRDV